jgi:hypothetical protein
MGQYTARAEIMADLLILKQAQDASVEMTRLAERAKGKLSEKLQRFRIKHAVLYQMKTEEVWGKHKDEIPEKDHSWPSQLREQHIQLGLLPASWPSGGKP